MTTVKSVVKVRDLQEIYVKCRVRRHLWDDIQDDGGINRAYKESPAVARFAQRCTRCTTRRYEAWNKLTGEILFVQYVYPVGYSLAGNDPETTRPWNIRKEYMDRIAREKRRRNRK